MSNYQFKVNDQVIKHPTNWAGLPLGYDFDGTKAGAKEIAQLLFCDSELRSLFLAQFEEIPCFEYILSICFRCKSTDPYEEIFFTTIRLKDLSYFCDNCEMQIPSKRNSVASDLDEDGSEEKCFNTQTTLELFQVQSGGTYFTQEREVVAADFISIVDLVNLFIQDNSPGAPGITSLVHNQVATYEPASICFTPIAIPVVDTIITLTGEFGQVYNITVAPGAATIPEYLERIASAFCCVPDGDINMTALEFNSRIAYTEINGDTLCIYSYWNITSMTLTVGGVTPAWFVETIVDQQLSSQDLYISPKGLFGDQVCISWDDLKSLIVKMQGGFIKESYNSESFEFEPYCSIVENLPTTGISAREITSADNVLKSYNTEWFVNKVKAGTEFRVEDFQNDSLPENWTWWGQEIVGPIFNVPDNCITFADPCFGRAFGRFVFENTGAGPEDVVVNVYIDTGAGLNLIDSHAEVVPSGGGTIDVFIGDGFPNFSVQEFFPGDRICINWRNETNGTTTTGPNVTATNDAFWSFLCTPCFDSPFLNEDDIYGITEYGTLSDFTGCKGTKTCRVSDDFYLGLGFAYDQQISGNQAYNDTHFITYCNPDGTARKFPKCFYFQNSYVDVCDVYKGQFIDFSYYNAPLQLPSLLKELLCQIPSGVSIPSYEWTISVDGAGFITKSDNIIYKDIQGTGGKCKIEFDICANEFDLIRALQYGSVNIDLCGVQGTALIENFEMTLGNDRRGNYRVCI